MKIFSRYVLKEMIGPTLLGFIFYTSIILMRQLFDLAGLIIKRSLSGAVIGKLLLFILPHIMVLTLPMSLLFGILIAVGRLSSDSEIVAMRALGISTRTIYRPVFFFSFLMAVLNFYLINSVMPESNRQFVALQAELTTSAAENVIKPRVFHTGYANLMIYVDDVDPGTGQWKGVFVADSRTDPSTDPATASEMAASANASEDQEDIAALSQQGGGQRIIVANHGNLALIGPTKDIWMNLGGAETHVWDPRKPDRYDLTRNETQRIRLPSTSSTFDPNKLSRSMREMNLRELLEAKRQYDRGGDSDRIARNIARIEIHKKFAIPFACIAFGILGLPLGITNRRGGKSSGFTLSIAIIVVYYVLFNHGEQLASDGKISAALGMWGPNLLLLGAGLILLSRANKDFATKTDAGIFGRIIGAIGRLRARRSSTAAVVDDDPSVLNRLDITFPNILDRYILREFLKVLGIVVLSVLGAVDDHRLHRQSPRRARERHRGVDAADVLPRLQLHRAELDRADLDPGGDAGDVRAALKEQRDHGDEIERRLALPHRPAGNGHRRADERRHVPQSRFRPAVLLAKARRDQTRHRRQTSDQQRQREQKLWYRGKGRYLINFLAYDRDAKRLTQVQVYELHPTEFRMTRRVFANRATWNGKAWVFEDGWVRSFPDNAPSTYTLIKEPLALYYPETPDDFALEVRLPDQMTYAELRRYLQTLRASGYTADALAVKLYEKTSWPALSLVMAMIALPFAFRMGKRGALYGIAIALVLGIVYWIVFALFMKFGEVGNLPPLLAAWAANILFGLAAAYMFLNVET
jgi:lipopolysaccharide export LptBFGC system permease protein LptF